MTLGLAFTFILHATSSISLVLLNKLLTGSIQAPWTILLVQNSSSILLTFIAHLTGIATVHPVRVQHLIDISPLAALYLLLIWSSLQQLSAVPVSTVVIARSLIPLITAAIERFYFKTVFAGAAYAALNLIWMGNALYSTALGAWSLSGLFFVGLNLLAAVSSGLAEKRFCLHIKETQTPAGLVLYRNLLSLPAIAVCVALFEGSRGFGLVAAMDVRTSLVFACSCFFSYTIGNCVFYLQKNVSSTTVATANNCYKLMTLLGGLLLWPIPLTLLARAGVLLNFAGVFWYSLLQTRRKAPSKLPVHSTNKVSL